METVSQLDKQSPKPHWYHPTPDKFLIALLPAVGFLFLSERFRWFAFNEHKNWTVLIAVAVICVAVVLLLLWFGVSLVLRRRFQFSIRSLLVLVAVVAVVCSWFSVEMQQARRQKEAVEGADLASYGHELDGYGYGLSGTPEPPEPPWLRNLVGEDFLSNVGVLGYRMATDANLERLKGLTSLQLLLLESTEVTDAGLVHLKGLTNLQMLRLKSTQVTDAGIVHLKGLTNLKNLHLSNTRVTDVGLRHLEALAILQSLYLANTKVSHSRLESSFRCTSPASVASVFPNPRNWRFVSSFR